MPRQYWLMKSEPDVFSLQDLKKVKAEPWNGVRNYQARNYMRDNMKMGDRVLFYHSNCQVPGVAGIAEIARESYPDNTCWESESEYYDPKSSRAKPRWFMVDLSFIEEFSEIVSLSFLKQQKDLQQMRLLQKGSRLSVMPVQKKEFERILALGRAH